jgi:large subunit ribosomal protein L17
MLNQMAAQLFEHKRIQTTETKAKRLQPVAERLVTFAKRGDLHARRRVMRQILDKSVVHELFTEIAPLVENREGGYTRIVKTGFRKGDNAPLAVIELVLEPVSPKPKAKKAAAEQPKAEEVVETPAEETEVVEEAPAEETAETEAPAEEKAE